MRSFREWGLHRGGAEAGQNGPARDQPRPLVGGGVGLVQGRGGSCLDGEAGLVAAPVRVSYEASRRTRRRSWRGAGANPRGERLRCAERMVRLTSAHLAGDPEYTREAGRAFVEEMVSEGRFVC